MKQVVIPPGDVKVPLELTSEFTPYRLPVVLQGDKRVEGILTVIWTCACRTVNLELNTCWPAFTGNICTSYIFLHSNKAIALWYYSTKCTKTCTAPCNVSETKWNWNPSCFRPHPLSRKHFPLGGARRTSHVRWEASLFSAHAWHVLSFLTFASTTLSWTSRDMQR